MQRWYEKLTNARKKIGLEREDLAALGGPSVRSLGTWEGLTKPPRFASLIQWANSLGFSLALVPYDQTFTPDGRVAFAVDDQPEMIKALRSIREDAGISLRKLEATSNLFTRQALSRWENAPDYSMQVQNIRTWALKVGVEILMVRRDSPLYDAWVSDFTMVLPKPIEGNGYEGSVNETPGHKTRPKTTSGLLDTWSDYV